MRYYTGIGSRNTPASICMVMSEMARQLAIAQWTLRSGGADGADLAFEQGAGSLKEIFLPWPQFNGNQSDLYLNPYALEKAEEIILKTHACPHWHNLKDSHRKLHGRNVFQIMGPCLFEAGLSQFVICWTPGGEITGGTATALRLAHYFQIPVFNFGNMSIEQIEDGINALTEESK